MINQDDHKQGKEQDSNNTNQRNEGFSGGNISTDYNPAPLKTELDIDSKGSHNQVERARNANANPNNAEPAVEEPKSKDDNKKIEEPKSLENRDRNSDVATNRYPASHPENHENRGDMKLDE